MTMMVTINYVHVNFFIFHIIEENYVKLMSEIITVSKIEDGFTANNSNSQLSCAEELPSGITDN